MGKTNVFYSIWLCCLLLGVAACYKAAPAKSPSAAGVARNPEPSDSQWVTRGFEAFRRGTFGNAGQNLYVSRDGILQRIHLFDLNRDGYVDVLFSNAQEFLESPPAYVYTDPLHSKQRIELPAEGAVTGAVADLNGDGLDDLIVGNSNNGATSELNSTVYFGSSEGLSPKYQTRLPIPACSSICIGDFNGDGRPDVAGVSRAKLRVFYQTKVALEPKRFVELDLRAQQIAAGDLDGDGFADLYALLRDGSARIFWGASDGIQLARATDVPAQASAASAPAPKSADPEPQARLNPLACIVKVHGQAQLFMSTSQKAFLVGVNKDRTLSKPLAFGCPSAVSVAAGDLNANGQTDLVFACRDKQKDTQYSYIYWGSAQGYDESRRTPLAGERASDVAVGDLDADGRVEIVLCLQRTEETHSVNSLIYRVGKDGIQPTPILLPSEGARRGFIACPQSKDRAQVIFINQIARAALGRVDAMVYYNGPDGFSPDRNSRFPGLDSNIAMVCDVNDDAYPDVLLANCAENARHLDQGSHLFLGSEKGFTREPSIFLPTRTAMAVATADINRDGYLDLIFSAFAHNDLMIFFGSASGPDTKNPRKIVLDEDGTLYNDGRRMCLADLNNDGWLDLVVTDCVKDHCFILWGSSDGFSFDRRQTLSVIRSSSPHAVDLDGNGYLDLVIGGFVWRNLAEPPESFVYIYWNSSQGLREDRKMMLPAGGVMGLAIVDLNNDGILDLFAGSYQDGRQRDADSYIYWGSPGPMFSEKNRTLLRTHSASGVIPADFNEDGWIDLAVSNHKVLGDHKGDSFIWWNSAQGFDRKRITALPTSGPHGMMHVPPGNQRDRGPEEYYISEAHEVAPGTVVKSISWQAELPPKTWVKAQLRTANTREELEKAPWQGPSSSTTWFDKDSPVPASLVPSRFLQYRLALGSTNSGNTPRLSEVRVRLAR